MSWTINFIGKPENVVTALEKHSNNLTGASKIEYDAALPHFVALIKENFGSNPLIVKIIASGHGYEHVEHGEQSYRQCSVIIEQIYGTLV